ncbi:MAG: hypothetical protein IPN90_08945 [Elusimicrobia bacterium]|nr:hypothetical protein [Elusimicrobiota bacterium]
MIGNPARDLNLPPFRFNNYPLRSIALQGATWAHLGEGWPDPWQRSITELAKLLKLRPGDAVRIATSNPQHLMALTADGTMFFGETGLNEYPRTAEIIPLSMVERFPPLDELMEEFTETTGLTLEPPTKEELETQGVDPSVHEELLATVRRLPSSQATPANIQKMEDFFRHLSRSARDAHNPVVVHHRTAEVIRRAHIILYGPGTQESNIISSTLPLGINAAIASNPESVKIYWVNPTKENKKLASNGATLLGTFYRHLSRPGEMPLKVNWSRAPNYVDYAVGHDPVRYPGLDPDKEYNRHSPEMIKARTRDHVVGVAIDLESKIPRDRPGVDYKPRPPEYGFFHDPLTKETVIALYAIKAAGEQLTSEGSITPRKKAATPVLKKESRMMHMRMIRRRMEIAGISVSDQDALLAEMNDFTIKSQQWFYVRLMRRLGLPIQQWLPECQNAEWTEMTSRMVELLNSVTEVISLDYDDTLEPRNTDLGPVNARRLAQRIAAGQKITFNTAKTPEELSSVMNAKTGEQGVEIFGPLREALVDIMRGERTELSQQEAENAADDLLHDMFFLYMNTGGALARPTVRGIARVAHLPLDPYFTVVYPPELKDKITGVLAQSFEFLQSNLGPTTSMALKFFNASLRLMKMIILPFGPNQKTTKSERAPIAEKINALFKEYNIPARVNPAGTTSIDVNQVLPGGQVLEKSRAIQHLFNQGHRTVTFIDNEIIEGNAVSVRDLVVEMAAHPERREGRTLRVIPVDKGLNESKLKAQLGLAGAIVHRFPEPVLTHPSVYRPSKMSGIVIMNGLTETEATAAFLKNAPYGPRRDGTTVPKDGFAYEGVLGLSSRGWTRTLFRLDTTNGRRDKRYYREKGLWSTREYQEHLPSLLRDSMVSFRDNAKLLRGRIDSVVVVVAPGFKWVNPHILTDQVEQQMIDLRMGQVDFKFLKTRPSISESSPSAQPFSVREQKFKALAHGAFALTGAALAIGHLALGLGSAWALPAAIITLTLFFRYAWKAALARNEHLRLMAKASQWDPNNIESNSSESLAAIQSEFRRFGFNPTPAGPLSFAVNIKGKQVNVRLPRDGNEFSDLLSRKRLAETHSAGNSFEIVVAPGINPALIPSVVITEIHRVSPTQALLGIFKKAILFVVDLIHSAMGDRAQLARRDMRAFGVPVLEEERRPVLDLFMPPLESLDINSLDGRAALLSEITQRMNARGSYAREWAGTVDTVVSFHQVLMEDIPSLREFIKKWPGQKAEQFQIVLVPGANDPLLETALAELSGKNVTVLKHSFESSGEVKIDGAHFQSWSQGLGAIAWLTTKNPRAAPILSDPTLPLLIRLLDLLKSALPLTRANLDATAAFARALLSAA